MMDPHTVISINDAVLNQTDSSAEQFVCMTLFRKEETTKRQEDRRQSEIIFSKRCIKCMTFCGNMGSLQQYGLSNESDEYV